MALPNGDSTLASARRLEKILSIVACPECHGELSNEVAQLKCTRCKTTYPVRNGKFYFIPSMTQDDELDALKNRLKRVFGKLYYIIGVNVIAPTFPFRYRSEIRRFLNEDTVVVDLGAGNHRVDEHIITLDGVGYAAIDIVADLRALPFRTGSLDGVASRSVLEHIPSLGKPIDEIKRCTRPGGFSMHLIPFLFPYHASPGDFQRLTASGAAQLFDGWDILEQHNATGPATLFLVCFIEFLAILTSFGSTRVKAVTYLFFCLLMFPLKFLDILFVGRSAFLGLAPSIFTVARKPPDENN
jgi:uncharacterized protein YbaR (Trm112 family)